MNLPGLTTTPRLMAAALDRVAGAGKSELIDWTDDPTVGVMVRTWPAEVRTRRAEQLGLVPDESFDDIVRAYLTDSSGGRREISPR
jgi:hypothetical protein